MKREWLVVLAALGLAGCQCGGTVLLPCSSKADCAPGQECLSGKCDVGGGGGGIGGGGGGSGGGGGGGTVFTGCDQANPANGTLDSDCDGFSDAEEYGTAYGSAKTDPCNSDSDGDGVLDGVEMGKTSSVNTTCGFAGDADPSSRTGPTTADSDGDGLK
ncbi:MAG: hypothetical protein ACYC8T_35070, partial [Myxococcaceae bacterium]